MSKVKPKGGAGLLRALDRPKTVVELSEELSTSPSTVRRHLHAIPEADLSVGFTRPRTYWVASEEIKRLAAYGDSSASARNGHKSIV